jgi:hypothetical protein
MEIHHRAAASDGNDDQDDTGGEDSPGEPTIAQGDDIPYLGPDLRPPETAERGLGDFKPISSAISIGTGGPFGAEGPIILTGGAIGSIAGQLFRLIAAQRRALLVAGAAAGMSAVFGTAAASG